MAVLWDFVLRNILRIKWHNFDKTKEVSSLYGNVYKQLTGVLEKLRESAATIQCHFSFEMLYGVLFRGCGEGSSSKGQCPYNIIAAKYSGWQTDRKF